MDTQQTEVVAIFDSRSGAENAVVALNREGVDHEALVDLRQELSP
jgi:hypothetical protein